MGVEARSVAGGTLRTSPASHGTGQGAEESETRGEGPPHVAKAARASSESAAVAECPCSCRPLHFCHGRGAGRCDETKMVVPHQRTTAAVGATW